MIEGEQLKKVREWCGFNFAGDKRFVGFPDGTLRPIDDLPPASLDSLFKWAVPKTLELIKDKYIKEDNTDWARWFLISRFLWAWNENPDDPAQALLQAIADIIKEEVPSC